MQDMQNPPGYVFCTPGRRIPWSEPTCDPRTCGLPEARFCGCGDRLSQDLRGTTVLHCENCQTVWFSPFPSPQLYIVVESKSQFEFNQRHELASLDKTQAGLHGDQTHLLTFGFEKG